MSLDYIPTDFGKAWVMSKATARRGVHVPLSFIDINNDNIHDAIVFAQIMYWHEPNEETGQTRLTQEHDGNLWLAKNHGDWYAETRIKKATVRKCLERLKERNLIIYFVGGFAANPTPFIRVNWTEFEARMKAWVKNPSIQKDTPHTPVLSGHTPCYGGTPPLSCEVISNTKTTTETTTSISLTPGVSVKLPALKHNKRAYKSTMQGFGGETNFWMRQKLMWQIGARYCAIEADNPEWEPKQIEAYMIAQDREEERQKAQADVDRMNRNTDKDVIHKDMFDAIRDLFNSGGGEDTEAGKIRRLIMGESSKTDTTKRTEWYKNRLQPGIICNASDLRAWATWYRLTAWKGDGQPVYPKQPELLSGSIMAWYELGKPGTSQTPQQNKSSAMTGIKLVNKGAAA